MNPGIAPAGAPVLSVLCLTYNHEAFAGQMLDAILAQVTDFEIEVVVADDCSTDATVALVEGYRARFGDRLRLLPTPVNLGVTRNFRRALAACRGRYVAICEGDDHWTGHTKLQAQVDFLEAHPDFVISYHAATVIDREGRPKGPQLPARLQCDASQATLIGTRPISTLTACFRNVLHELPVELDQAPALDLCLWSLLGLHGKGKYLPLIEPAMYRVHGGGVFSMQGDRNRYLMTAQSLLCLARVHARQDRPAVSRRILFKAALMATWPMGGGAVALLTTAMFARLVARPLWRTWVAIVRGRDPG